MVHLRRSSTRLSDIEDNTPSNAPVQASYVLLAEFNIDLGLILAHQYPAPTGIKESVSSLVLRLPTLEDKLLIGWTSPSENAIDAR
jgi:hypothetical protein